MVWAEASGDERLEMLDKKRSRWAELLRDLLVQITHLSHKRDASQEDTVVPVLEKMLCAVGEVVHKIWHPSDNTEGTKCSLHVSTVRA